MSAKKRLNPLQRRRMNFDILVFNLVAAEKLAAVAGLWKTYHAINRAKREAGYERAVQIDPKGRRVHDRARAQVEKGRS